MADIFFICKHRHRYTLRPYLTLARQEGDPGINLLTYDQMSQAKGLRPENLKPTTYVFADMDRATPRELGIAAKLADEIRACGPGYRVINDPTGIAERYEFLRLAHLHGINGFNAYLLAEHQPPQRFPVFLRSSRDSRVPLSDLIEDQAGLEAEIYNLTRSGVRRDNVMIVEFQPTDLFEGNYVKYGAYCAAGEILPGHVHVCRDWRSKLQSESRVVDDRTIELERQWMTDMQFRDEIANAFAIAGVEYGRIDFGISDGRPQFWEINTNPDLLMLPRAPIDVEKRDPVMMPNYLPIMRRLMRRLAEAAGEPA